MRKDTYRIALHRICIGSYSFLLKRKQFTLISLWRKKGEVWWVGESWNFQLHCRKLPGSESKIFSLQAMLWYPVEWLASSCTWFLLFSREFSDFSNIYQSELRRGNSPIAFFPLLIPISVQKLEEVDCSAQAPSRFETWHPGQRFFSPMSFQNWPKKASYS